MSGPHPRPLYPRERDTVPIVQETGWAPGPVSTGGEKLASTGIRSPDRPARSESLYRLSYRGPSLIRVRRKSVKIVEFEPEDIKFKCRSRIWYT